MNKLSDGSRVPSSLKMNESPMFNSLKNNFALKIGKVVQIIYPEHPRSVSKKEIEYDVAVVDSSMGAPTILIYRNCRVNNLFGAVNNNEVHTYEVDADGFGNKDEGATVLILCIEGNPNNSNAMIMGGFNSEPKAKYSEKDGQFYDFNFNGVNINVNKDGELTIKYQGLIDKKGKLKNKESGVTQIKIDKTGKLKISDNEDQSWEIDRKAKKSTWTNKSESITIDKGKKSITVNSGGEVASKSKADTKIQSDAKTSIESKGDASIKSNANMSIESGANITTKAGGNWQINVSGNVQVQAGGNAMITAGGIAQIKGSQTLIGDGAAPVALAGISQCVGTGNKGSPVISTVISGSSTVLAGT